jgi:hypothetical protein
MYVDRRGRTPLLRSINAACRMRPCASISWSSVSSQDVLMAAVEGWAICDMVTPRLGYSRGAYLVILHYSDAVTAPKVTRSALSLLA